MFNILCHKGNAKQNSSEIPSHPHQIGKSSREQTTTNAGQNMAKRNPHTLLMGMEIRTTTMKISMAVSQKTENRIIIYDPILFLGKYLKECKPTYKRGLYSHVYHSTIYNKQCMQST
jgi:hypothetical protein